MDINVLSSGGVAGVVELFKQVLKPYALQHGWTDEDGRYVVWVTIIALVASLVAAAIGLLASPETSFAGQLAGRNVAPVFAVVVAAFPIAFGNLIFHKLYDLLRGLGAVVQAYADKLETSLPRPPIPYVPDYMDREIK